MVEIKGELVRMTFITNNFEWSANFICRLYKSRWGIEVFFNMDAMLTYVILRFV